MNKRISGSYYTKTDKWKCKIVNDFLDKHQSIKTICNPFAGGGDSSYIDPQFINKSLITISPLSMKDLYMTSKPIRFKNYDLMLEMKKHFGTAWINKKIKDWRSSVNKYIRDNNKLE